MGENERKKDETCRTPRCKSVEDKHLHYMTRETEIRDARRKIQTQIERLEIQAEEILRIRHLSSSRNLSRGDVAALRKAVHDRLEGELGHWLEQELFRSGYQA